MTKLTPEQVAVLQRLADRFNMKLPPHQPDYRGAFQFLPSTWGQR